MSKKQPHPARPLPLKWEFGPDIPTYDYIEDHHIDDLWGLQEAVANFIHKMEDGQFLAWESVIAHEQGLPLTEKQEAAFGELLNFGDPEDDRVLYINEIPRTSEPWYAILNKIAPRLLIEPFWTADVPDEVQCDGWRDLTQCLREHASDLSLPPGVSSPVEVVPLELRHKLWLQYCFDALSGLGQDEELTLENEEQQDRLEIFIRSLRDHKDTVRFFSLTLDSLLERVILPERDRPIFVRMMQEQLGLKSTADPIADCFQSTPIRLSEDKIKAGIVHPDRDVRDAAVMYFSRSACRDPSILPLAIQAIEKYGWEGAFIVPSAVEGLPLSEETLPWILRQLERDDLPDKSTMDGARLARGLGAAAFRCRRQAPGPPQGGDSQPQGTGRRGPQSDRLRIDLLTVDAETCGSELDAICLQAGQDRSDPDTQYGYALVEALARHGQPQANRAFGMTAKGLAARAAGMVVCCGDPQVHHLFAGDRPYQSAGEHLLPSAPASALGTTSSLPTTTNVAILDRNIGFHACALLGKGKPCETPMGAPALTVYVNSTFVPSKPCRVGREVSFFRVTIGQTAICPLVSRWCYLCPGPFDASCLGMSSRWT
jgi:hypothetical protein